MRVSDKLLLNRICTPDGTTLTSRSVHDYREYKDNNGKVYMVDGGLNYKRRNIHPDHPHEELCVYTYDNHTTIRNNFEWGTRGKGGREPLRYVKLKDLSSNHIEAILATQYQVPKEFKDLFLKELTHREVD